MGIQTREEVEDVERNNKTQSNYQDDMKERLRQKAEYVDAEFTEGGSEKS